MTQVINGLRLAGDGREMQSINSANGEVSWRGHAVTAVQVGAALPAPRLWVAWEPLAITRRRAFYAADDCAYPVASLAAEPLLLPANLSPGLTL